MKTSSKPTPKQHKQLARALRKRSTDTEGLLWSRLRNRGLGIKFRRQVPVGSYIVDFLSLEVRLIVEVDGGQHGRDANKKKDRDRDRFLMRENYEVVRFWTSDIKMHLDECLQHLGGRIEERQKLFSGGEQNHHDTDP